MDKIRKDIISAIFLALLSISVIFLSFQMSVWQRSYPGEGLFPLIFGVLLLCLSISLFIINIKKVNLIKEIEDQKPNVKRMKQGRLFKYLATILFYVICFDILGYVLTTGLVFLTILIFIERRNYFISFLVTLITVFFSFFLFNSCLNVPLPLGIIKYLWE